MKAVSMTHANGARLVALYRLTLLDRQRGYKVEAALAVLAMLEGAGLAGVMA